jgi:hypothetical protein
MAGEQPMIVVNKSKINCCRRIIILFNLISRLAGEMILLLFVTGAFLVVDDVYLFCDGVVINNYYVKK